MLYLIIIKKHCLCQNRLTTQPPHRQFNKPSESKNPASDYLALILLEGPLSVEKPITDNETCRSRAPSLLS